MFRSLLYIIELSELFENSLVSNVCLIVCFVQGSTGRPGRRGSRGRRGDKVRTGGSGSFFLTEHGLDLAIKGLIVQWYESSLSQESVLLLLFESTITTVSKFKFID